MPPSTDPPAFDVANLRRVLALRQRGTFPSGTLTLASLELYHGGFIAVLWIEQHAFANPYTMWVLNARDNLGNRYIGKMRAGSGGGIAGGRFQTRSVHMFTPALNPAATTLTFELRAAQGSVSFIEGVGHVFPNEDCVGGPWHVEIAVEPAPAAAATIFVDNAPYPTFNAEDVWHVIPVGHRQSVNDYALTIFSLELCRSGFIAVMRADYARAHGPLPDRRMWVVSDDLGRDYRGYDSSGSGGGIFGKTMIWRMDYHFRPALSPDARQLTLSIDYIGSRPPPNPDGLQGTVVGPWIFEIDLTAT